MWNAEIITEACTRFNGEPDSLRLFGGFYHNIYQYHNKGKNYLLKIFPSARKDRKELTLEMNWITKLRQSGLSVPKFRRSVNGETIELIHRLPFPCYAISYELEKGDFLKDKTHLWNDQLFHRWGNLMGKMHAIAKQYDNQEAALYFDDWNEGEIYHHDLSFTTSAIYKKWRDSLEQIRSFPRNQDNYGLIHNHLNPQSFLVDGKGNLSILHFDHIKLHWFTYDIAVSLYYALELVQADERAQFKERFLKYFYTGYSEVIDVRSSWEEEVNFFLEFYSLFRYLYLMIFLHQDKRDEQMEQFLTQTRTRLEKGISLLKA